MIKQLLSTAIALFFCFCPFPGGAQQTVEYWGLGTSLWIDQSQAGTVRLMMRDAMYCGAHGVIYNHQPAVLGEIRATEIKNTEIEIAKHDDIRIQCLITGTVDADAPANPWDDDVLTEFEETNASDSGLPSGIVVTANRLTPAIMLTLNGVRAVDLFAGEKNRKYGWGISGDTGLTELHDYPLPMPLAAQGAPQFFAVRDGTSIRQGRLADTAEILDGAAYSWALLWHGSESWILSGRSAGTFNMARTEQYKLFAADIPWLLVCSQTPAVRLTGGMGKGRDGALRVSFPSPGARIVLLPLMGSEFIDSAASSAWEKRLPAEIVERCDWWAAHLDQYPVDLNETISWDAQRDIASIAQEFSFTPVREGEGRIAPLPPMLSIARENGFPVEISAPVVSAPLVTYCGPYSGVENASAHIFSIKGMGRYALEHRIPRSAPTSDTDIQRDTQRDLEAEIDRLLDAGHLAPIDLPLKMSWGWVSSTYSTLRLLYSSPGKTLAVLASSYPFMNSELRNKTIEYMIREREQYPPETMAHLPSNEGARRDNGEFPDHAHAENKDKFRQKNFHFLNKLAPAEALYDLAAYYAVVGQNMMEREKFDLAAAMEKTIKPWLARREWATLGWFSWPLEQRDWQHFGDYGWNTMADANRQVAALIGMIRLARMAGDRETESLGLSSLSLALAHRFALGKYVSWRHSMETLETAPDFDVALDFREVSISEKTALLGYGCNQIGLLPFFPTEEGPLACMVPELARFCADYLEPECRIYAGQLEIYWPDSLVTAGSPRRAGEWWHNYPQDSRQIFMLNAWILAKDGDWLARRLDVPWFKIGDLYHIEKLAETLMAFSGVEWAPISEPAR